jgi:hypothetical protein
LAIVHVGTGEHGADRYAAVGGIQVQLVAVPGGFIALRVALGAAAARLGQFSQQGGDVLLALAR